VKQQLRENKLTNVEVIVQAEAFEHETLFQMKLDNYNPSSMDLDASVFLLLKHHVGK